MPSICRPLNSAPKLAADSSLVYLHWQFCSRRPRWCMPIPPSSRCPPYYTAMINWLWGSSMACCGTRQTPNEGVYLYTWSLFKTLMEGNLQMYGWQTKTLSLNWWIGSGSLHWRVWVHHDLVMHGHQTSSIACYAYTINSYKYTRDLDWQCYIH